MSIDSRKASRCGEGLRLDEKYEKSRLVEVISEALAQSRGFVVFGVVAPNQGRPSPLSGGPGLLGAWRRWPRTFRSRTLGHLFEVTVKDYLSISFLEYGWRGLGYGFSRWDEHTDGTVGCHWYPVWTLKLGPVQIKRWRAGSRWYESSL